MGYLRFWLWKAPISRKRKQLNGGLPMIALRFGGYPPRGSDNEYAYSCKRLATHTPTLALPQNYVRGTVIAITDLLITRKK